MRISDWSSDVCSSDLSFASSRIAGILASIDAANPIKDASDARSRLNEFTQDKSYSLGKVRIDLPYIQISSMPGKFKDYVRSEEHTSELQSLMRISYAVFCLKKNKQEEQTRKILID